MVAMVMCWCLRVSIHRLPENKVPLLEYRPDPRFPLLLLLCLGFVVWWLVERHSIYGWVLQDILGRHRGVGSTHLPGARVCCWDQSGSPTIAHLHHVTSSLASCDIMCLLRICICCLPT